MCRKLCQNINTWKKLVIINKAVASANVTRKWTHFYYPAHRHIKKKKDDTMNLPTCTYLNALPINGYFYRIELLLFLSCKISLPPLVQVHRLKMPEFRALGLMKASGQLNLFLRASKKQTINVYWMGMKGKGVGAYQINLGKKVVWLFKLI